MRQLQLLRSSLTIEAAKRHWSTHSSASPGLLQQPAVPYGIGDSLMKKLRTVQNSAARVVTGSVINVTCVQLSLAPHAAANTVRACHDCFQVPSRSCPVVLADELRRLHLWSCLYSVAGRRYPRSTIQRHSLRPYRHFDLNK